jgi:phage terminase small subunit
MQNKELNAKQQRFVAEYLIDLNGSAAYQRSGYKATGKSASSAAARLLDDVNVKQAVAEGMERRGVRMKLEADDVVREIERMAMFDPAVLVGLKSPEDIAKAPEEVRRAITGWKWDRQGNFIITTAKAGALEMLGRHHKLFTDKIDHTGAVSVQIIRYGKAKESQT